MVTTSNAGEDAEKQIMYMSMMEMEMVQSFGKTICQFLIKLNVQLIHPPNGIYPKEMESYSHIKKLNDCS